MTMSRPVRKAFGWGLAAALVLLPTPAARAQEAGTVSGDAPAAATTTTTAAAPEDVLPSPTPGPVVTLREAFDFARARHPRIRSIRQELEIADAQLAQAWGALLPRVSAQLMYTLNDQATVINFADSIPGGLPIPMEPIVVRQQHIVQSQLQIGAPLFNLSILSYIDTAEIGAGMAALGEEEVARQLLLGVAMAYYGCLMAREVIGLQQDAFDKAKERLRAAQVRLDAEVGVQIDVARARLEMETARANHEAAILAYENAREALAGLLVMDELPEPVPPEEEAPPAESADELVEEAVESRSDVRLAEAGVDLAEQQLWTAWTAFFPTLNVAWQLQTEITDPAGFGGRRNAWALVFVLSIPIYDQSRYGLLDQRRAELTQAEIDVETAELGLRTEIRSALREYESALTSIDTAQRQSDLAREALGLAEAGLLAGAATSLDVENAQQQVNATLVNITVLRFKARMALVKLMFLAGREP